MQHATNPAPPRIVGPRTHVVLVIALIVVNAGLAAFSLLRDSATFDEPLHLTCGYSVLATGDYRLSAEHPPLARVWAALPLLATDHVWPARAAEPWVAADVVGLGRQWLFELNDNGQALVVLARLMMLPLLSATLLVTYALGRQIGGPDAGLLALVLAAFSPSLLAHGRLITTDVPVALAINLTLLAFAWLLQRLSWPRLLVAASVLALTTVTKFSWPLVVPGLLAMAAVVIVRRRPLDATPLQKNKGVVPDTGLRNVTSRGERAGLLSIATLFVALVVWAGIWTAYGWRTTVVAPLPADVRTPAAQADLEQTASLIGRQWAIALHEPDGTRRAGMLPWLLVTAARHNLLPDAYLFGLARAMHFSAARTAYFMGEHGSGGWVWYFPTALLIKTPVATLLLVLGGLAVLVVRRGATRNTVLLAGVVVFVLFYGGFLATSNVNLGQRHLLPVYPGLFAVAGLSTAWLSRRAGRWAIGLLLLWLVGVNAFIAPQYLAYFNELVGGPRRGHRYLADSNIDWGQDLLRLQKYAAAHPNESIKLAYFGSAVPTAYVPCTALPSYVPFEPRAELTAGTYVVSLTQLLGVYDREVRDEFWAEWEPYYAEFIKLIAEREPGENLSPEMFAARQEAMQQYEELRHKRLLNRLQDREPDDRAGYSLLVYRLSAREVANMVEVEE